MFTRIREQIKNQKGFTLVELMIVIAILGVLAAVAIPRYASQTTSANTAKIATDLRTIDDAVNMAIADGRIVGGTTGATAATAVIGSTGILVANNYLAAWPAPPSGSAFIQTATTSGQTTTIAATETTISGTYTVTGTAPNFRTVLLEHHAEDFHK